MSSLAADAVAYPRLYRPAAPPPGQGTTIVVPGYVRWELLTLSFALITNATVANRLVRLLIGDGTANFVFIDSPYSQPASSSISWFFQRDIAANFEVAALSSKTQSLPLIVLESGWQIQIQIGSQQATDQVTAISFAVLERLNAPPAEERRELLVADPAIVAAALGS